MPPVPVGEAAIVAGDASVVVTVMALQQRTRLGSVVATRNNALNRPKARYRQPLTREQYSGSRMIADPLCLYDFCLETEGAVAIVTTSVERARDLRQRPVPVVAAAHGGTREAVADRLYAKAGVTPRTSTWR